ncbi:MAG: 16S rRNA (guanine(966)-N(2))-methyltransferase RsmD [Bacteroidetes bacterium GWA2_30_7]|nr:MAG: 16S rRNA (guanine(966)-N(2))-methyltransferase RsmD [Bacteroidetes bacterium GWA2_30_7]
MRIISGKYKGRQINPDKNFSARPTTDIAKEGLFNILNNNFYYDEISVLDLFAGTGGIGYEFASRGCENVTSVELNPNHHYFIKKTADSLKLENFKAIKANAFSYLKNCYEKYDVIFADPPYESKDYQLIPQLVFEKQLLKENGWLIIEHPIAVKFPDCPQLFDKRNYSKVNFSFFKTVS